jgi:transcriptional regulator with XRE-family HTH domain
MSKDLAVAVGKRLVAIRRALGLNQIEFAAPANLSQPQYNQFEKGKRLLTVEAALRLCAVYSLSMD